MRAAREILEGESHRPLLIGVTVLTSMSQTGHQELGSIRELGSQVDYLAGLGRRLRPRWCCVFGTRSSKASSIAGFQLLLATPGFVQAGQLMMIRHESLHQAKRSRTVLII